MPSFWNARDFGTAMMFCCVLDIKSVVEVTVQYDRWRMRMRL